MIKFGETTIDLNDPVVIAALIGLVFFALLMVLVIMSLRASARSARAAEPIAAQMGLLGENIRLLSDGQNQLAGGLKQVNEAQSLTQAQMINTMEKRLEEVQRSMGDTLHGTSTRTARSLGELHTRLATIDKAQSNIEKLSGDVLSLQDILSNKQTRGAFGEIQLNDIVSKALAPDAYNFQATLSNGKRADCLIHLPNPPGPIVIDSKFPLEAYEAIRNATTNEHAALAGRAMRTAVRTHIKSISEK
jgi:DNA recombination protein RmuC